MIVQSIPSEGAKNVRPQDRVVRMRQIYETIDRQKFQWIVVFVAGVGFFLDGYTVCPFLVLSLSFLSFTFSWEEPPSSQSQRRQGDIVADFRPYSQAVCI